jgi:hypothetical protein
MRKKKVCSLPFMVADCPDLIAMPGQYTFPFKVILPASLPASVFMNRFSNYAAIEYFLVA